MTQRLAAFSLLVPDYDEAIRWFTTVLDFELLEDADHGGGKRWVRVAPRGATGTSMLLARAANEQQRETVGRQGGGRVWLFLHTDDFARDRAHMEKLGVHFTEATRHEAYGSVAVFVDPWGNRWDLIEPK
jgi:catechol 2,3-dioxygenase-like lactoylglutathione lyase family enzyme